MATSSNVLSTPLEQMQRAQLSGNLATYKEVTRT